MFFICFVFIFSCKKDTNNKNNDSNLFPKKASLQGAWELISYLNYKEDGNIDTIISSKNNKQIKIYSDTKVMWSRLRTSDSLDWFGYGYYIIYDDTLSEILDFGSKSMNNIIKEKKALLYKIVLGEDSFSQIQTDSLGMPVYAKNYQKKTV